MSPSTTPTPSRPKTPQPGSTSTSAHASDATAVIGEIERLAWTLVAQPAPVTARLQLSARECDQLEEILGLGATRSVPDLLRAVDRLASLRFGDIRIPFTPGQLAELQHRAQKRGRTVEAEMKAVVDRIQDTLFYQGG